MVINKQLLNLIIVTLLLNAARGQRSTTVHLQPDIVAADAACLATKLEGIGSAPPKFEKGKYKIRGILQPHSELRGNGKLFLLFYGKGNESATLYSSFVHRKGARVFVYIGEWSTFKAESGRLVPDELPGGLGTHEGIFEVLRQVQMKGPQFLAVDDVQRARPVCTWRP